MNEVSSLVTPPSAYCAQGRTEGRAGGAARMADAPRLGCSHVVGLRLAKDRILEGRMKLHPAGRAGEPSEGSVVSRRPLQLDASSARVSGRGAVR